MERSRITEGVTRGVCRFLRDSGYSVLREFRLKSKRRADIAGIDRDGNFVIVEVKSSREDYQADQKWTDYEPHCDEFYFAVDEQFPVDLLPEDWGVIIADGFSAAIVRPSERHRMNGNRRRVQLLNFARTSSDRLEQEIDRR